MNATPSKVLPLPAEPLTRITLLRGTPPRSRSSRPRMPNRTKLFSGLFCAFSAAIDFVSFQAKRGPLGRDWRFKTAAPQATGWHRSPAVKFFNWRSARILAGPERRRVAGRVTLREDARFARHLPVTGLTIAPASRRAMALDLLLTLPIPKQMRPK